MAIVNDKLLAIWALPHNRLPIDSRNMPMTCQQHCLVQRRPLKSLSRTSCSPSSVRKNAAYIMPIVDRETRCFLAIQAVVYRKGYHLSLADKSETYSVEGGNADLRHYLTRLVRKSRCFSRCLDWLNHHIKAFAHAWNLRQLHNRERPFDKKHVIDFICFSN